MPPYGYRNKRARRQFSKARERRGALNALLREVLKDCEVCDGHARHVTASRAPARALATRAG